jgi:hypothetical protein
MVDDRGYERATLSPSQRQAPPIEALCYQAWRLSAKGWSTKEAKAADKKRRIGLRRPLLVHHSSGKKGMEFRL